ncbi:MAG: UDP-N-acetylmuramate dehydrogenase [Elusimicrobiota bacterium]|jgi:UDP-N-acetylmuramate dehydrogenase|nr:UDP-N-acetylmuramate dehydrogenase [Elusimicrobiota bacterium]
MKLEEQIKNLPAGIEYVFNAPMACYTTYKTGGAADILALPKDAARLKKILAFARGADLPARIFGMGSNILVSGGGLRGITVCLKNMRGLEIRGTLLSAAAGEPLDNIVAAAVNSGCEGMEFLSGIPGSCGGAVYMNAGAYGQETFDCLESFTVLDENLETKILTKTQVRHAYRRVQDIAGCIILGANWRLRHAADIAALKARRADTLDKRVQKQPLDYPSAGSVFKRPPDNFASALIDKCGLKGLRAGGAMVSPKHAGFIINYDNAAPEDIKRLMDEIQTRVFKKTGVKLEPEQILWGKF